MTIPERFRPEGKNNYRDFMNGYIGECCLRDLRHFDVGQCFVFDTLHNLYRGTFVRTLYSISFLKSNKLTYMFSNRCDYFNSGLTLNIVINLGR
jgi:hypothetical protein